MADEYLNVIEYIQDFKQGADSQCGVYACTVAVFLILDEIEGSDKVSHIDLEELRNQAISKMNTDVAIDIYQNGSDYDLLEKTFLNGLIDIACDALQNTGWKIHHKTHPNDTTKDHQSMWSRVKMKLQDRCKIHVNKNGTFELSRMVFGSHDHWYVPLTCFTVSGKEHLLLYCPTDGLATMDYNQFQKEILLTYGTYFSIKASLSMKRKSETCRKYTKKRKSS